MSFLFFLTLIGMVAQIDFQQDIFPQNTSTKSSDSKTQGVDRVQNFTASLQIFLSLHEGWSCEGGEALGLIIQENLGLPIPGSVEGQV